MGKSLEYLMRGFQIAALLAMKLPLYMADGKITIDEMVDFITAVGAIGGWKFDIEIPTKLQSTALPFKLVE